MIEDDHCQWQDCDRVLQNFLFVTHPSQRDEFRLGLLLVVAVLWATSVPVYLNELEEHSRHCATV